MIRDGHVLVVGPSWIGDMVMAQSLFMRLKKESPQSAIDVLAPKWSLPLLERMPEVRNGIELDVAHGELGLSKRVTAGRGLRARGYSRAIVLPRSLKAALVPWFAQISRRTGFRGEWRYGLINDMRAFDARRLDQTVKRFFALGSDIADKNAVESLPSPHLSVDRGNLEGLRQRLGLGTAEAVVAMMPGAEYGSAKCWPLEKFAALGERLTSAGVDIWILGSAKERHLGDDLQRQIASPKAVNLCGRTELADTVDLLSAATAAVTNDSGLMHIAAAVGTHVVAIYGSSTPDFTPPLTDSKTVLYRRMQCSPCFQRTCPLGHLECLRSIEVDEAERAVNTAFAERGASVGSPLRSSHEARAER